MQHKNRSELYRDFIHFVQRDTQRERTVFKQRMAQVFLWCFLMPAVGSVIFAILVKAGIVPVRYQRHSDWVFLIFPIIYAAFFLWTARASADNGGQALPKDLSGFTGSLTQALKQSDWRDRVCTEMGRQVHARPDDWPWIVSNFRMDLGALKDRTKFLTAFAGAVFFMIFKGIDLLGPEPAHHYEASPTMLVSWVEGASNQVLQLASLIFFLVLLYLSGMETFHSLERYLNCAELMRISTED